jgi:hypothetical protein
MNCWQCSQELDDKPAYQTSSDPSNEVSFIPSINPGCPSIIISF